MKTIHISKQVIKESGINDVALYISKLMDSCGDEVKLEFEKDVYEFRSKYAFEKYCYITNNDHSLKRIAMPIIGKKNITISGNGSKFLMIGQVLPFYIEQSENITIEQLDLDYKRPFFTQGEILKASKDSITLKVNKEEYPYSIVNGKIWFEEEEYKQDYVHGFLEYDPEKKGPAKGATDTFIGDVRPLVAKEEEDGILELQAEFAQVANVGNIMTIKHEPRYIPGIAVDHSKNIHVENVNVYQAGTMALVAQFSENLSLKKFNVKTEDGSSRMVSSNADATHFVGCRGKVVVEDCLFESQLDDALNVHGNYLLIDRIVNSKKVIAEIGHFQQVGIFGLVPGGMVEVLERSTMLPKAKVKLLEKNVINNKYVELIFEEDVPFEENLEYCLDDCDSYPEVEFRNNIVRNNRARGILLTSRKKTLIENNVFETEGATIKISGDMDFWFESGATSELIIRNNTLKTTCNKNWGHGVIDIDPEMTALKDDEYYHQNIVIENNKVTLSEWPFIYGKSVDHLTIKNNEFLDLENGSDIPLQITHIADLKKEGNCYGGKQ